MIVYFSGYAMKMLSSNLPKHQCIILTKSTLEDCIRMPAEWGYGDNHTELIFPGEAGTKKQV